MPCVRVAAQVVDHERRVEQISHDPASGGGGVFLESMALCRRVGMRYRDILLWRTQNNMGNAAVMGLVPQVRYILLSDLLLETMTESQIEAVFAHELGHIVHRHMAWYIVFFGTPEEMAASENEYIRDFLGGF